MEIHLRNPWLTYGIGLHRLREAGLLPEIFGRLDEQPLTLDQLHEFCKTFLVGDNRCIDLPHPRSSWNGFFETLRFLIDKEKNQWNPVKKKVMPWIDLDKLQSMHEHHHATSECTRSNLQRRNTTLNDQYDKSQRNFSQRKDPLRRRATLEPEASYGQQTPRSQAFHCRDNQRLDHTKSQLESIPVADLQSFILTAPLKFPPANTMVEPHKYFAKWKAFDSEAFVGMSGDELTELLLRGMLFPWPDANNDTFFYSQCALLCRVRHCPTTQLQRRSSYFCTPTNFPQISPKAKHSCLGPFGTT